MAINNSPNAVYSGVIGAKTRNMSMSPSGNPDTSAVRPPENGDFLMVNFESKASDNEYRPRLALGTHHCGLRLEAQPFEGGGQLQLQLGAWPLSWRAQKPGSDASAENAVDDVSWEILRGTYNEATNGVTILFQRSDTPAGGTVRNAPYFSITIDENGLTFDLRAVNPETGAIMRKTKTIE